MAELERSEKVTMEKYNQTKVRFMQLVSKFSSDTIL